MKKGFYYDIDLGDNVITESDLEKLEKKMNELAKQNNPFIRKEISKADAIQYFEEKGEVCPADWEKGKEALVADAEGIASYLSKH